MSVLTSCHQRTLFFQPPLLIALLLSLAGCSPPCAEATPLAPAPHRLALSWPASSPSRPAHVTWSLGGEEGEHEAVATVEGGDRFRAVLSDLPELTEVSYALWEGDVQVCAGREETGPLPAGLPRFTPEAHAPPGAGAWSRLAAVFMGEGYGLAVIDREGRYRWHHREGGGLGITALHAGEDGLRYNTQDPLRLRDLGAVRSVSWAGEAGAGLVTPGAHHAFAALPDGGAAFLAVDAREWVDPDTGLTETVVGDALWEVGPDGALRQVFTLWDHEEPARHARWDDDFYPGARDWSHGNGVSYDEARGSYLVSLGNLDTIYEIERQSGAVLLRIRAGEGEWSIQGTPFHYPHSPSWTEEGTLLVLSYDGWTAGAVEYAVDAEGEVLTEVWRHLRGDVALSFLGSAHRQADGATLINYGAVGWLEEVSAAGEVTWALSSPLGYWLGTPEGIDEVYPGLP